MANPQKYKKGQQLIVLVLIIDNRMSNQGERISPSCCKCRVAFSEAFHPCYFAQNIRGYFCEGCFKVEAKVDPQSINLMTRMRSQRELIDELHRLRRRDEEMGKSDEIKINNLESDIKAKESYNTHLLKVQREMNDQIKELKRKLIELPSKIQVKTAKIGNEAVLKSFLSQSKFINDLKTFEWNRIRTLSLNCLNLSQNKFEFILNLNLSSLQVLNFSENQIKLNRKKYNFNSIRSLKTLYLGSNAIEALPTNLHQLKYLNELDLTDNKLTSIEDSSIFTMPLLTILCLTDNRLISLPSKLSGYSRLERIDLSCNKFEDFPKVVTQLTKIKSVHLGFNRLKSIPQELQNLSQLQNLNLQENKVLFNAPSRLKLPNLITLNISGTPVSDLIIQMIKRLNKLQQLKMDSCKLTNLSGILAGLSNLRKLEMNHNAIAEISEADLRDMVGLQHLSMKGNCLTELYPAFLKLKCVKSIDLAANFIKVNDEMVVKRMKELRKKKIKLYLNDQK